MSNYFEYYNANPKGLNVGDCVKRAISKASNISYRDVSLALNRYKKVTGASKFNSNENYKNYLTEVLHAKKETYQAIKGEDRMSGYTFAKTHPTGRYVLRMARHLTACVDGVIYDTWNCLGKCVYMSWRLD